MKRFLLILAVVFWPSLALAQGTCLGDNCQDHVVVPDTSKANTIRITGPVIAANAGVVPLAPVAAITSSALGNNPAYNNGQGGQSATLTATTNGALVVDGYTAAFGDRILVNNQQPSYQNGIYVVTSAGSGSTAYQLVRSTDFELQSQMFPGVTTYALNGKTYAGAAFVLTTSYPVIIGSTPILFTQYTPATLLSSAAVPNVSGSAQTTTGTITAGGPAIRLDSSIDFANGQGILINHAGASFTKGQPSSCSVTPTGTPGLTGYTYKFASIDGSGGVSAAVTQTTSTGNATLSATNYNALSCTPAVGSAGMAIWGGPTSGSLPFLGIVAAGTFHDIGASWELNHPAVPYWLPSTAPTSALPDWLVTTVKQGGGSNILSLANPALNNATEVNVLHDDTVALQAGFNQAIKEGIGFFFATGTYGISSPLTWCSSSCGTPMNIAGAGMYNVTIVGASPNQDFIQNNSFIGSTLHDIGFLGGGEGTNAGPFQTGGSLINTLNNHAGSDTIYNVVGSNAAVMITMNTAPFVISNIVGDFVNAGGNFPFNIGDSTWTDSYLNPQTIPGAAGQSGTCILSTSGDPGGFRFINNKCIGGMLNGLSFSPTVGDGDIYVAANSFECDNTFAACAAGVSFNYNGANFGNISIMGPGDIVGYVNGVTSTSRAAWLGDMNIGNGVEIGNATNGVNAGGTTNMIVSGAVFQNTNTAINVDSNSTGCNVGINSYSAVNIPLTDASSTCGAKGLGNWIFLGSGAQIALGANAVANGIAQFNGGTSGSFQIGATATGAPTITNFPNTATANAVCYNTVTDALSYNATNCTVSARRFKNLVSYIDPDDAYIALHHVKLRAATFTYKPGDHFMPGEHAGFFADDVCDIDERLCIRDAGGKVENYDERGLIAWQYAASQASVFTKIAVWLDLE